MMRVMTTSLAEGLIRSELSMSPFAAGSVLREYWVFAIHMGRWAYPAFV